MEGIRESGLGSTLTGMRSVLLSAVFGVFAASAASAQLVPVPADMNPELYVEENVNVTGTRAPYRDADGNLIYNNGQLARQENEPSCGVNPLNPINKLCAYNWYGFADLPNVHGDTWIGFSETIDGRTFKRRPLTGYKSSQYPVGKEFAADPTVLVAPGIAFVTSIAGDRAGNSVMLIQRMMELNREFGFRHVSEDRQVVIESLQGVHFIDKPDAHIIIDPNGGFTNVEMTLEEKDEFGNNLVVSRRVPNFRIVVTFADFGGSGENVRTWSTYSDGFGAPGTWSNKRQISNTSGLDQGLSVASIDSDVLYVWRRFDSGEGRASIVGAHSRDRAGRIGKAFDITDICEFDQETAPNAVKMDRASVRSNGFPWLSAVKLDSQSQESYFVLAYAERPRDAEGNCLPNYDDVAGTRIMIRTTSDNGKTWSPAVPVMPFNSGLSDDPPVHFQFMPTLACARGSCNVVYYSTLAESEAYDKLVGAVNREWEKTPFIEDFSIDCPTCGGEGGRLWYRRFFDLYSSKITIGTGGIPVPSASPERVSKYQIDFDENGVPFEKEWNPANIINYGGNTVPFIGDYLGLGIEEWRFENGNWMDNASPVGGSSQIGQPINRPSYFAAWTDNRRVRALYDSAGVPLEYKVPENVAPVFVNDGDDATKEDLSKNADQVYAAERAKITEPGAPFIDKKIAVVKRRPDRFLSAYAKTAEGVKDENPGTLTCAPQSPGPETTDPTRIKDSEIYGATIEDWVSFDSRIRLVSPAVAKNFLNPAGDVIQRAFVIGAEHVVPAVTAGVEELPRTLTLVIENQPAAGDSRASWRQLPFEPSKFSEVPVTDQQLVTVEPQSTEYVTLFVVSGAIDAPVTVKAYDGGNLVSQITVNGLTESGDLIDPGTAGVSVLESEIHDPIFLEPNWGDLETFALNPNYKNPNLKNPNYKNPNYKNTDYMNPNYKNPNLKNPNLKNTTYEAPNLKNPNLKNPNLKNPNLKNLAFVDATYTVESNNNTTTAINADFAFAGDDLDNLDVQVIAWQADELDSLQDCDPGLITETKVISAKLNPNLKNLAPADIANPFPDPLLGTEGNVTFPIGPRGRINVTLRIFCFDDDSPEGCEAVKELGPDFVGYNVWSQAANTGKYTITDDERELKDVSPPLFKDVPLPNITAEATSIDGADVTYDEPVATDSSGIESLVCLPISDSTFIIGTTSVTCTAIDKSILSNMATTSFDVTVSDTIAPVLQNVPGDMLKEATGPAGESAYFTPPTATDLGQSIGVTCDANSGDTFPLDTTTVTCITDPDGGGNTASGSFDITVQDTTPPILVLPGPLSFEANDAGGRIVIYVATASDLADLAPGLVCAPLPNTLFPIGVTTVSCVATDASSNSTPGGFTITISDTSDPVLQDVPADMVKEATGPTGAVVNFTPPTATDLDQPIGVTCDASSGATFPLGTTPVTCVTNPDGGGNTASASFDITVQDTTAPVVSVPDDFNVVLDDATGSIVNFVVTAEDIGLVDPDPVVTCSPASGDLFPPGTTTVSCTATDNASNTSSASTFDVILEVGEGNGLSTKRSVKAGSVAPITWSWTNSNGDPVDIGQDNQDIEARVGTCPSVADDVLDEDPGSSGFQLLADLSWKYNWQTVDEFGNDITGGAYCIKVTLLTTGQYQEADITVR